MTLKEYIDSNDSNAFWRMSSGDHQNLLEEAIEALEDVHTLAAVSGATLYDALHIVGKAIGCDCCVPNTRLTGGTSSDGDQLTDENHQETQK